MLVRAFSSWGRWVGWGREIAQEERRVWVRHPSAVATILQPADAADGEPLHARVRNVSRGGIQLTVSRPFELGELLSVELPGGEQESSSAVLACVVRSDALASGEWVLGCTFSAELGDDDLQCFGAQPARSNQRASVRFPCPARASLRLARTPEADACPAEVLDLSASGVGLRVAQPLPLGALVQIELRSGAGSAVRTTLASIVRVTTEPGGAQVLGCNFITELTEQQMRDLL